MLAIIQLFISFCNLNAYFFIYLCFALHDLLIPVVAAEKAHQNLLDGVEHFDKSQMKHATTEEKNILPPIEGFYFAAFSCTASR